ncbi:MAG: NUDIX domain-containing protein [Actinomycetota bacterium]|nr:NUDIX domain-containing protein [Actinomycetota bacterium]
MSRPFHDPVTPSVSASVTDAWAAAVVSHVRRSVVARRPVDGREARSRHRLLVALGRLEHPLDGQADPTHLTGSAVVTGPSGVLLLRHKRLGIWVQPGGHLEAGETPWDAARRESEEETGLRFEAWAEPPPLLHLDVHPGGRGHTHLDLRYALRVSDDDTPRPPAGESQAVGWFAWPDAIVVADPGLAGILRAVYGGNRLRR